MSFFRHQVIDAAAVGSFPDLVTRVHAGELDGAVVRDLYTRDECADICARLETNRHALVRTDFPAKFRAFFYGVNLNLAEPDLRPYFAEAVRFRDGLMRTFPGPLDLERRVGDCLRALDQGREYCSPPGPAPGQRYMFTTLRAHRTGGYIPVHFDDEQAERPSYRGLTPLLGSRLLSFVLAFSCAEDGGETEIFNIRDGRGRARIVEGGRSAAVGDFDGVETFSLRLEAGAMIVFRSGEFLHRLTPVVGARTRWTAVSFMAQARNGRCVYCWG